MKIAVKCRSYAKNVFNQQYKYVFLFNADMYKSKRVCCF